MRTRLPLLPVLLLPLLFAACSGEEEPFPDTIVVRELNVQPVLPNSELIVGANRFVLGLLDAESRPIVDANVHLKFYDLNGAQPKPRFEMAAVSRVPARDAGISEQVVHVHADGTRHVHVNATEEIGVYTAQVEFDRPGIWGVEINVRSRDGKLKETVRPRFTVLPKGETPAVGEPAPRSQHATLADVESIDKIDSAASPEPAFHRMTIGQAIEQGRPALVLFAVPGYCTSRFCGPQYEIMKKLLPAWGDRVEFIHVEFFKDPGSPAREPVQAAIEWRLRTEPWFFLINSRGIVAAKFEGPTSLQELEEALRALR